MLLKNRYFLKNCSKEYVNYLLIIYVDKGNDLTLPSSSNPFSFYYFSLPNQEVIAGMTEHARSHLMLIAFGIGIIALDLSQILLQMLQD